MSVYFNGKEELDESPDSGAGLPNSLPSPAVSGHQLPLSSTPIVSSYILRQAWVHRAEREGMWVRTASSQLPECQDCAVDAGLPSAILRIRQLMDGNGGFSTSEKSTHGSCRLCDVLIAISSSSSTSTDAAALSSYINHYKPSIASGCALIPSPHACSSFPCSLLSHLSSCASYSPTHPSRANTAFGKCQAAAAVLARSASAAGLLSSPPAPLSGPARTLTAAAVKRIMISSGYSSPAAALLLAYV